jgi:hypothetical protein
MTAEERKLCRGLIVTPPRGARSISKAEFLRQFPSSVDRGKLALRFLEEACNTHDAEDLNCALIVGHTFGFGPEHTKILCRLVEVDWHYCHEDIVTALDQLRTTDAVEALFRATQWIPESLEYDDSRALAVKAIWALGNIPGNEAEAKLEAIVYSNDAILQKTAEEQLERRRKAT